MLQGAYNRGTYLPVDAREADERRARSQAFKDTLTTDPRLNVRLFTEKAVLRGAVADAA